MKKFLICMFIAAAIVGLSCATAPTAGSPPAAPSAPAPSDTAAPSEPSAPSTTSTPSATSERPVAQENASDSLNQIYDTHRSGLDLAGAQNYTVVSGDTLSDITRRFYGGLTDIGPAGTNNGFYFPVIMLASNNVVVDPDLIYPGMRLVIPDLRRNLANAASRRAIKDCLRDLAHVYNRKGMPAEEQGLLRLSESL